MYRARVGHAARILLCVMVCVATVASGPQQQAPPKQAPSSGDQPAVKVTSRLVEVNVIVLDKKGQPVRGLTRDDFEVFDENEPQAIRAFSMDGVVAPVSSTAPEISGVPKLPPNTFSNRAREAVAPGTLSVVLFDELNTKIQDKLFARTRILRFLSQLRPQDRVAIYLLSDRLRVLHDFTNDSAALLRVIDRQTGTSAQQMDSSAISTETIGDELIDSFLENASRRLNNYAVRNRVRSTLNAVEWIARHLSPVVGRKNLIWVSGGFPLTLGFEARRAGETDFREQDVFTTEVLRASRAINAANIAIYPIDARGLFADPQDDNEYRANEPYFASRRSQSSGYDRTSQGNGSQARDAGGGGGSGGEQSGGGGQAQRSGPRPRQAMLPPPAPSEALRKLDATIDSMVMLAERTGGRAFYNSNDIDGALRETLDESQVTYRLAFEPTHNRWDGKFRRIKVKMKQDGLRIRHRLGYVAHADPVTDASTELAALREAAASPIDIGEIAIRAQVLPAQEPGDVRLRIFVRPSDLLLASEAGQWIGSVDVFLETADKAGAAIWSDGRRVAFTLNAQQHAAALRDGLPLNKTVPRTKDATQLRIAIRDVRTGALGSLRVPLSEVR